MQNKEALKKYNISDATIRNWKKLNFISDINNIDLSEIDTILKNKIGIRRNKRMSQDSIIPKSYVEDNNIVSIISKILEVKNRYNVPLNDVLHESIISVIKNKSLSVPDDINKILGKRCQNDEFIKDFEKIDINYSEDNDFLGCLYMSLLSVGNKDINGIYYTPFNVVNRIIKSINFNGKQKILDPGCGSGNFLIQTFKEMKNKGFDAADIINNLYGFDVDPVAVLLAKVNIYILDNNIDFSKINIFNCDFLNDYCCNTKFDCVIGNPPWGKKYNREQKELLKSKYNLIFSKLDSFSQFIIRTFDILNEGGILSFVLPSSILNIAAHEYIRKFLLDNKIIYIKKIGREFEEIVTDVVLIQVQNAKSENNICKYNDLKIEQNYFKNNPYSNFLVSDFIAASIIDKLKKFKHFHLTDNVEYALGIVTGDNKKYLSSENTSINEPIISGKDICRYKFDYTKIKNYIVFEKDKFQQVANEELYRHKNKIIYKFIGKKLCFAVENRGILTLNSANIICINNGFNINYISAVLNSRITQLYFDEYYDTHKVLKNHIQNFYIPIFNNNIITLISDIVENIASYNSYNEKIENIIYNSLELTDDETEYLKMRYR